MFRAHSTSYPTGGLQSFRFTIPYAAAYCPPMTYIKLRAYYILFQTLIQDSTRLRVQIGFKPVTVQTPSKFEAFFADFSRKTRVERRSPHSRSEFSMGERKLLHCEAMIPPLEGACTETQAVPFPAYKSIIRIRLILLKPIFQSIQSVKYHSSELFSNRSIQFQERSSL